VVHLPDAPVPGHRRVRPEGAGGGAGLPGELARRLYVTRRELCRTAAVAGAWALFPVDPAEMLMPQQRVKDADRAAGLGAAAQVGKSRIAPVPEIFHGDCMLLLDSPRVGDVGARDVVVTAGAGAADAAHEVVPAGDVQR